MPRLADHSQIATRNSQLAVWLRLILAAYWITLFVATHWPGLQLSAPDGVNLGVYQVDKLLHMGAFGTLAALLVVAVPRDVRRWTVRTTLIGSLIAAVYASLDEYSQTIVALERTASLMDATCNLAGVVAVLAGVATWQINRGRRHGWALSLCRAVLALIVPVAAVLLFLPGLWLAPWLPVPSDPSRYALGWRYDWLGHFVGSAAALWLIAVAAPWGAARVWLNRLTALIIVGGSAPLVEMVQSRLARGNETGDVVAHYLGLFVGLVVAAAYLLAMRQAQRGAAALGKGASGPLSPRERAGVRGSADEGVTDSSKEPPGRAHPHPAATTPPPSPAGRGESGTAFVTGAAVVSVLTFISRISGLVRESVMAAAFGRGPVADAFVFAFAIPNLFRRLFGEGALSAALIPVYAGLLHKDRVTAQRLASACLGVLFIVTGTLTLLGEGVLVGMLAARDWSPPNELAIRLAIVMLPYMPLVCLVAVIGSVLQVHHKFASTAAAPVVLNLFIIVAALLTTRADPTDAQLHRAVYVVSLSVLAAGAVQLVWQVLAVVRVEPLVRTLTGVGDSMRTLMRRFVPTAIGLGIFQINTFLDNAMAMGLRTPENGSSTLHLFGWNLRYPLSTGDVAGLGWAQRLYEFPLGIFGIAIATAIFPLLARAAAAAARGAEGARGRGGDEESVAASPPHALIPSSSDFATILRHGLRLTVFIGLPASVGLLVCDLPLVRVILERRQFTLEDSLAVAFVLDGYVPAIWAYSMNHVITRGFYSLGDTKTPLLVSTFMVLLNLTLNLTLVWFLGAAGFAWSTAICAMLQCMIMLLAIRHYVEKPVDREVWLGWARTAALTLVMGVVLWLVVRQVNVEGMSLRSAAAYLLGLVCAGIGVFLGGAWFTRAPELHWLLRRSAA